MLEVKLLFLALMKQGREHHSHGVSHGALVSLVSTIDGRVVLELPFQVPRRCRKGYIIGFPLKLGMYMVIGPRIGLDKCRLNYQCSFEK